jgi:hypothetical protein
MKRFLVIIIVFLLPLLLQAQNFSSKAKVNPVNSTSFYKIKINADIISFCNNELQDLRLFDNDGKEVPYLLNKERLGEQTTDFETYPFMITQNGTKGIIIVENKNKHSLNQFLFEMKNADATRLVRISGSDNKDSWFVVRDSFYFESYSGNNAAVVQKLLQFPQTDYAFYKIEISNGNNESPLNIIRIGNDNTTSIAALFQPVNGLSYKIVDSLKSTFIYFRLKQGNKIDKLSFSIDAPEMYKRNVMVKKWDVIRYTDSYDGSTSRSGKMRGDFSGNTMNAELSSMGTNNIICASFLGEQKYDSFVVQILNQDDAPLHIKDIKGYQLMTDITAKLEKDKSYFLYFGDSLLSAPAYDLVYFQKNIPDSITSVDVQAVQPKQQQDKDEYNGNKDKWIVWIGLGIAGITILLLTVNMMKKMKHTEG